MNGRASAGVAAYLAAVAAITYYFFANGEIFLGVSTPVLGGIVLAGYIAAQVVRQDTSRSDVRVLTWISAVLVIGPVVWYLIYGCVFGCPG